MANRSEAYDFSLFEPRYDNTVPIREPQRKGPERAPHKGLGENVVELPQKELEKNAQPKRHPFKMAMSALCFAAFMLLAVAMVYSQEQLARLTEEVNAAAQTLEEGQSLEVQLNMQASQKMDDSQVEEYATKNLGMSKILNGQVTYVNVAQEDKGTVIQSAEGGSILDQALAAIRSWFAD